MSNKARDLASLAGLTAAAYTAAQARMGALKRKETELREKLDALAASRQHDAGEAVFSDPARRAGADLLWQRWVDTRRSALNKELVNNLVAQTRAKTLLTKEFGRHEAIKGLREQASEKARAEQLRRAERNGF
ncbi:hypothetical protein [Flavimaricola marinus]|uniref:Flagellar FliJ protein n=1 Tax=Flavimaricola marinus TaxID=1819565 RepID=A0A238LF41_9RHOB|nr:hypothetical protein [Flavimaricola marinus]SMY08228.1 hypothetical protein LOM8899_02378 [Flavimaricola marinus]